MMAMVLERIVVPKRIVGDGRNDTRPFVVVMMSGGLDWRQAPQHGKGHQGDTQNPHGNMPFPLAQPCHVA